jgi:antitoxin YefM
VRNYRKFWARDARDFFRADAARKIAFDTAYDIAYASAALLPCKTQFPTYFFSVLAIFRKIAPSASEMSQKTVNVSEARARLYALLDETAASHEPILITGKRANAVLIAEEDWRAIQETLFLLSIPGMRESIREGLATPVEECSTNIEW